jgi:hypothetical protein
MTLKATALPDFTGFSPVRNIALDPEEMPTHPFGARMSSTFAPLMVTP